MSAPGRRRPVPRYDSQRGQLARHARRDRRGAGRRGPRAHRRGPRVRGGAAARATMRSASKGDGLLPGEQRGRRRAARPAARPRAGADRRLGRAPRERDPGAGGADATVRYVSLHQHPWYPGTGMADERGVGNVFNVPRGPGAAARALRRTICGPRSSPRRPAGRPTWCWSPPASTPCAAIRSAGSPSSPSTTPISPAGCASGCPARRSSACSRAVTCLPASPTGCWRTSRALA